MTLRVVLAMTSALPFNPIIGHQYEAPYIGNSDSGDASTNVAPTPMPLNLTVTVLGLTPGLSYNLYQYRATARPLMGPLDVPDSSFNANSRKAFSSIMFTAAGTTFETLASITSDITVTFRCVPTTAP